MDLDYIRKLIKQENLMPFKEQLLHCNDPTDTAETINSYFFSLGRISMLEDIIKWERGLSEREFNIARRKKTL